MNLRQPMACAACLLNCMILLACHKSEPRAVTATISDTNASSSAPTEAPPSPRGPGPMPPAPPGPVVVSDQGGVNSTLEQLSLELRKYVVRTRSVPRTYEEFIAKSNVQAPAPPA